jgi:hypothetical protein
MENRTGGIINVTRPDAIIALPQTGLNPFVFQSIQLLDEDKEESTGISKLSQGLNKDAVSKQNSADMVGNLITVSQQRQKIIARQFAEGFMKPLWLEVYQLARENEKTPQTIEVSGKFVEITPEQWPERDDVEVEFALGYNEQEKEANKYIQMDMMLAGDPTLKDLYPLEKRFNTISRALQASGIRDVATFLVNPADIKDNGPDPMQKMQIQMAMKELEIRERAVAVQETKLKIDAEKYRVDLGLKTTKVQSDVANDQRQENRADIELQHNIVMDHKEMSMAEKAQDKRAIFSPDNA